MTNRIWLLAAVLAGGFAWPPASPARTWIVRVDRAGDAPTIQAGIDSAAVGDTVIVQGGRYQENIDFKGKDIVLKGAGAGVSYIEGYTARKSCVAFISGEGRGAVLEGFTITRGSGQPWPGGPETLPVGGGIIIYDGEPVIQFNEIVANEARHWGSIPSGYGGGITCGGPSGKSPVFRENVISRNIAGGNGGGIAVDGAAPLILRNEITLNETTYGDGGGIWLYLRPHGTVVEANRIVDNLARDHGGGIYIGLGVPGPGVWVYENLLAGNIAEGRANAEYSGGGIWIHTGTNVSVFRNTLVGNRGRFFSNGGGGGIVVLGTGSPSIEQNIIALSPEGGGIRCGGGSTPVIRNNLGWQNSGGDGLGLCADWGTLDGNLIADPLFCNVSADDYTLAEGSPALTHPAGPLGAFASPGCPRVPVKRTSWGAIKALFERK